MTTATTTQVHRISIKATPEAIWQAITDPDWNERYGYGGRGSFDLRPGGRFEVAASQEFLPAGAPPVIVDGEVLETGARLAG